MTPDNLRLQFNKKEREKQIKIEQAADFADVEDMKAQEVIRQSDLK